MSSNNIYINTKHEPSIYISYVYHNITEKYITDIFNELNIGKISHIDMKERIDNNNNYYYIVFIHFEYWFDNKVSQNLRDALNNNKEVKIIFENENGENDNYEFWKLYVNNKNQQRPYKKINLYY
jgi:flagellar hook protein FlgE